MHGLKESDVHFMLRERAGPALSSNFHNKFWIYEGEPGKLCLRKVHDEELVGGSKLSGHLCEGGIKVADITFFNDRWSEWGLHCLRFDQFPIYSPEKNVVSDLQAASRTATESRSRILIEQLRVIKQVLKKRILAGKMP
uniref:Uncharacterized protein n=1 Tax=Schistocephalus solidus TaxID=70667 RepID=A0A0X3PM06_SCHSO